MASVADMVADSLIGQIHKYKKDLTVVQSNVMKKQPSYPYIAIDVIDPNIQIEFSPIADHFNLRVQLKVVTNDKRQYHELLEFTKRLFFLQQPTADLARQGIGVINIEDNPPTVNFVDNFYIFDGGFDLILNIYHHEDDFTQSGELQDSNLNFERND